MKKFQSYSNEVLLQETKNLVQKEREVTLLLIECLEEVEVRMLYAKMGYSSLWTFCTQYLGLSEGAAQRRIAAMRLGRQVPEAKDAIAEGRISLSNASKLESFFANEKKQGRPQTLNEKKETIEKVQGMSQSDCEKKLFEISPQFETSQKEVLKPIAMDQNLLRLVLDSKVVEQLNLLKNRLAHQHPNASYSELIAFLVEDKLKQIEKKMQPKLKEKGERSVEAKATAAAIVEDPEKAIEGESEKKRPVAPSSPTRKTIPTDTRRSLWKRSGGRCEFVAPNGNRCNSAHALEIDHIRAIANGGENNISNLRYVCRIHNGLFAVETFSSEWMEQFLPKLRQ